MIPAKQLWGLMIGVLLSGAASGADVPTGAKVPASSAENPGAAAILHGDDSTAVLTSSPSSQYVVAYDSMTQADWLKKQGMVDEAFVLYTEAQTLFKKLAAEHPLWETNVVAFRIKYCADELAKLRPLPPAPMAVSVAKPTSSTTSEISVAAQAVPRPPADDSWVTERLRAALKKERAANMKSALEGYLTVLEEHPQNRDAIKGAGRCYLRAGLPDEARALLQRGMSLPHPDAELNLLMALVYCVDKEFYKAYQLLLIVINEQPTNAAAHLAMGVTLAGLDKLDNARVETQKAIQLDPKLGDAYYNLARISLKLNPSISGIAREYYYNALRYGSVPDPTLEKQLQ